MLPSRRAVNLARERERERPRGRYNDRARTCRHRKSSPRRGLASRYRIRLMTNGTARLLAPRGSARRDIPRVPMTRASAARANSSIYIYILIIAEQIIVIISRRRVITRFIARRLARRRVVSRFIRGERTGVVSRDGDDRSPSVDVEGTYSEGTIPSRRAAESARPSRNKRIPTSPSNPQF